MGSFDNINYSLRPSKSIERSLVFEGLGRLQAALDLNAQIYVGMGSIWFADFLMAHRLLGIDDMVSIEADDIGYTRAEFNRPYRSVDVRHGRSGVELSAMYLSEDHRQRPWIIWLDYDGPLDEEGVEDLRNVFSGAPHNTILLTTFSATGAAYGKPKDRHERLKRLLGGVVPDDLDEDAIRDGLPETLASVTMDFLTSAAEVSGRPGGFVPAFKLVYTDSATMVTVGGILPRPGARPAAKAVIDLPSWPGIVEPRITAPHLTLREAAVLQAQLPTEVPLTRDNLQGLGFDLKDEQLASYASFYRYYPTYAQINF
ncbi:O-methyltransferase [Croceibacterium sp. TMG7-5b_MA50]|uniref:O-methyltransferase n=1 Tax=Croceibacterium sp. TMG7-5b_MA50 TaxID=3121290 RepID=UPI003221FE53